MRQVVSYIRVSTAMQGKSGLGIEAQSAAPAGFVEAECCHLAGGYEEVATGEGAAAPQTRRPQLAAAAAAARKGKAAVFIRLLASGAPFPVAAS